MTHWNAAPFESATVLSTLETATRNHNLIRIPQQRKLIVPFSDSWDPLMRCRQGNKKPENRKNMK